MKKCNAVAMCTRSRVLVDQLVSLIPELLQSCRDVRNAVAEMVNAGSPALEKAANRRVRLGRRQQLYAARACSDEYDLHTLRVDNFSSGTFCAGYGFP